jgi:hypothetical protein
VNLAPGHTLVAIARNAEGPESALDDVVPGDDPEPGELEDSAPGDVAEAADEAATGDQPSSADSDPTS